MVIDRMSTGAPVTCRASHDRPDVFTPQRRLKQVRLQSVDNLEACHLPRAGE